MISESDRWNELILWFGRVRARDLPPNMVHAWRVNRYADSVCNGGLANFLSTARDRRFSNEDLLVSLTEVCETDQIEMLRSAIDYRKRSVRKIRTPKPALIPKLIAYDMLFKGASREETRMYLTVQVPDCLPVHLEAALDAALAEVENDQGWEKLDNSFFALEPKLRTCLARFSEVHCGEWRNG